MIKKLATVGLAAAAAVVFAAAPASAAPKSYDPNVSRVANPANACKSIPGTLSAVGVPAPASFDFDECVRTLAKGEAFIDVPGFGSPYEQCAALERGIVTPFGVLKVEYPYTFHAEPGDPLPNLVAHNRKQCANALYAFHNIEMALPAPPAGS